MGLFNAIFGTYSDRQLKKLEKTVNEIEALAPQYSAMSDAQLQAVTPQLKDRLANGESTDDILPQAFAAVREAARYIRTHYQEPIGLGHAARAVGLAPTYLSARFKKEMGVGFAEYLLDTRLAHVKRGLQDSSVTVKALSEQAGFADYQHFCKTFKKKVGVSPRAYRSALDKKA